WCRGVERAVAVAEEVFVARAHECRHARIVAEDALVGCAQGCRGQAEVSQACLRALAPESAHVDRVAATGGSAADDVAGIRTAQFVSRYRSGSQAQIRRALRERKQTANSV